MKKTNRPIHIVVTGPESSGKTTLVSSLNKQLGGTIVEEYAREYLSERDGDYERRDLKSIAFGQFSRQLAALKSDTKLIISDTCLLTISIWEESKYRGVDTFIEEWLGLQQVDFYLLCKPDIPWESDPLRESEYDRDRLFAIYKEKIEALEIPFYVVSGERKSREEEAEATVLAFLESMEF